MWWRAGPYGTVDETSYGRNSLGTVPMDRPSYIHHLLSWTVVLFKCAHRPRDQGPAVLVERACTRSPPNVAATSPSFYGLTLPHTVGHTLPHTSCSFSFFKFFKFFCRAFGCWSDSARLVSSKQAAKAVIECFESNCSPGQRTAASDSRSRPPRSSMKQPFSNQPRSNQRHAAEKNNADRKKLSGRSSAWSRSSAVGHSFSKLDGEQGRAVAGRAGQKRGSGRLSVVERETSSNKPVADAGIQKDTHNRLFIFVCFVCCVRCVLTL